MKRNPNTTTGRRPAQVVLLSIGMVLAATIAVTGFALAGHQVGSESASGSEPTLTDMNGNTVQLDPTDTPPDQDTTAPLHTNLVIPAVGLDVPLESMLETAGQITPPGFTSAYLVRNRGVQLADATTGTVFLAMHSLRDGGKAPGNYLIDPATQQSTLHVGDQIQVGPHHYQIDSTEIIDKTDLPHTDHIWQNTPGRLVIFTCLQRPNNQPSTHNLIITAHHTTP